VERANGGVRLEAHYASFGRAQSMVFRFRHPVYAQPTSADCKAIAQAYGAWENDGALLGYFLLRSEDSYFTRANVYSIDTRSRASFTDDRFERSGFIPNLAFAHLATSLAPVVRWGTAERGLHTGRTYATGLSEAVNDTRGDKETVNFLYVAALTSIFAQLGPAITAATGYIQCHYTESVRAGVGPVPRLLDITDVGCYELMGSQRRRTRHRSGSTGMVD